MPALAGAAHPIVDCPALAIHGVPNGGLALAGYAFMQHGHGWAMQGWPSVHGVVYAARAAAEESADPVDGAGHTGPALCRDDARTA